MRKCIAIAIVGPSLALATGCAKNNYVNSPVPAGLSPAEAAVIAQDTLEDQGVDWGAPVGIYAAPRSSGYIVHYDTPLNDLNRRPPREAHMLLVRNDGTIKDLTAK